MSGTRVLLLISLRSKYRQKPLISTKVVGNSEERINNFLAQFVQKKTLLRQLRNKTAFIWFKVKAVLFCSGLIHLTLLTLRLVFAFTTKHTKTCCQSVDDGLQKSDRLFNIAIFRIKTNTLSSVSGPPFRTGE